MRGTVAAVALLVAGALLWASGGKETAAPSPTPRPEASRPTPAGGEAKAKSDPLAVIPPRIGAVAYLDGGVGVTRNGRSLAADRVAIGMDVENFDTIATARDGTAEVEITSAVSPGSLLRIDPNTTFVLEVTRVGSSATASEFTVLRGALGFKVKKITGNQEVTVRTDNAVLGVRGTEFRVITTPTGDTLVTCREGEVEVRDGESATSVRPGAAVEKLGGDPFRAIPMAAASLEGFERSWYAERIEALRANALRGTRAYAERYERSLASFRGSFLALVDRQGELIAKWIREDREGALGSAADQMRDKKQIAGAIFRAQRDLVVLERLYHRLGELKGYHDEGVGRGQLRPGETTDAFFARFAADAAELSEDMHYLRYTMKLYARRNGGAFPAAPAAPEGTEDEEDDFDDEE